MQQGVGTIERALRAVGGHGGWLAGLLLIAGWLALPSIGLAAEGATTGPTEYRDIPYIGSRNLIEFSRIYRSWPAIDQDTHSGITT